MSRLVSEHQNRGLDLVSSFPPLIKCDGDVFTLAHCLSGDEDRRVGPLSPERSLDFTKCWQRTVRKALCVFDALIERQ